MPPPILMSKRYEPPPSPVVHTPIGDDGSVLESHASFDTPTHSTHAYGSAPNGYDDHDHDHHRRHRGRSSSLEFHSGRGHISRPAAAVVGGPYAVRVDPQQGDRAVEIKLRSAARPHMRAFHFAWLSFFIAFFGWFSIPPLMPTIKAQLQLTNDQVANANIAAVSSTIVGRILVGPLCDRYGPRVIQSALLVVGAVPVACAAFVTDYTSLVIVRFVIGLVGCSFVATTYWTSIMFSKEVVGSANALAAGWGNLGAGVTYLVTPLVFDLITYGGTGVSTDLGWRLTLVVPALFMVTIGVLLFQCSDDSPHGNFADLRHASKARPLRAVPHDSASATAMTAASGTGDSTDTSVNSPLLQPASVTMSSALYAAAQQPATWILAFQYACSFGIELQVHNVLSLYYYEDFARTDGCVASASDPHRCRLLSQTSASLISSLFGLMCLFARALGGVASDLASRAFGMRGRLVVQFTAFAGQAASLFVFSQVRVVAWSVPALVIFGVFVQACTGTTFAIVPYVAPRVTGAATGIVGAGGNIGALCWGFLFKAVGDRALAFEYLSAFVAGAALLCVVTRIDGDERLGGQRTRRSPAEEAGDEDVEAGTRRASYEARRLPPRLQS